MTTTPPESSPDVAWEKVLWRKQPFPDNHVPRSFLSELDTLRESNGYQHGSYDNRPVIVAPRPRPKFVALCFAALPISQHLAVIALFLAVFYHLLNGYLGAGEVGWSCVGLGIGGYTVRRLRWDRPVKQEANAPLLPPATPFRSLILPPLILSLLSPVLGTLTSATTSDSIWPLAGGLIFVHILLADFTTGEDIRVIRKRAERERRRRRTSISGNVVDERDGGIEEKSLTSSLSLTSALSASVVLASRLPSTTHVFSFVLLAVILFAGWPTIAKGVRESGKPFSLTLTCSMIILATSFFPSTSAPNVVPSAPTLLFLAIILLNNIVGPLLLWYAWRWKTHRGGGWDAAVVRLRNSRVGDR